jgi:hypothetical protein
MKKITLLMLIIFATITLQAQNKLLSSIDEYYDGTSWYTTAANNYAYDANNNLITETRYNYDFSSSSWKTYSKTTYVYNVSNKVTVESSQKWNTTTNMLENDYKDSYTYTSGKFSGQVAQVWDRASSSWVNDWKNELTFNANNLVETAVFYTWDGSQWVLDSRETIAYDVNNRKTSDTSENWDGSQWVNANKTFLSYNANNKIILNRSTVWDDINLIWVVTDKIDYVLDATGNRTTETNTEISTNAKNKDEYTYDTASLMTSFANPFTDKSGTDYFFEDFPYVNKLLVKNHYDYKTATSSYAISRRTTYDYNNAFVLANGKFETANPTLTVFPNPTTDFLSIKTSLNTEIDKVIVTDLTGKTVLEQNQNTTQINVQNLAKGMYILQVLSGDKKWQSKFLKE